MIRYTRYVVGLVLLASMTGGEARAQWGYGGWGWCGWGGGVATPESAALEGAGKLRDGRRNVQPQHGPGTQHQCRYGHEIQ